MLTLGGASKQSTLSKAVLRKAIASGHLRARRVDDWIYQIHPDDLARYVARLQVRTLARELGRQEDRLAFSPIIEADGAEPGARSLWRRGIEAVRRPLQFLWPHRVSARGLHPAN